MHRLPLTALLSQTLVAFIIEFDNEFERRMPHRTSRFGGTPGAPWLVSMAMWTNFLRHIPDEGIPVRDLPIPANWRARLSKGWGYATVVDMRVRPTAAGRQAFAIWRSLEAEIEERWRQRCGAPAVERLRQSLESAAAPLDPALPDCLPIFGYGLYTRLFPGACVIPAATLAGLLSKGLLALALEFESRSAISLAIGANVLRLTGEEAVRVRDLPALSGVSKEAIATALSFLEKRGYAVRAQAAVKLTPRGVQARETYLRLTGAMEAGAALRESLEAINASLPLCLDPRPGCWRASVPRPETLPHYPMMLHRGGYPDGS